MTEREAHCVPTLADTGEVVGWTCYGDMETRWAMALCEAQEREYEFEMAVEANETLFEREPELWSAREATDPYWPPVEVDPFEVMEPMREVW